MKQPEAKNTPNQPDRALTRDQAAYVAGVKPKTLANYATLNQGPPCRKHRGRVVYLESELQAWLRSLPIIAGGTKPEEAA